MHAGGAAPAGSHVAAAAAPQSLAGAILHGLSPALAGRAAGGLARQARRYSLP